VESPVRREAHAGLGERHGETDRQQFWYRAPCRLNHRLVHRALPCPVGSSLTIVRYRHLRACTRRSAGRLRMGVPSDAGRRGRRHHVSTPIPRARRFRAQAGGAAGQGAGLRALPKVPIDRTGGRGALR